MSGLELLENHPETAKVVINFYVDKFLEGLTEEHKKDESTVEFAKAQFSDPETISRMIDSSPRFLFDVFDANEVYVEITVIVGANTFFIYHVNGQSFDKPPYKNRKEAEAAAIEKAFEILNEKLCQTK